MEARSQMHYARRGEITDAVRFVAEREEISPELVRDEIAIGQLIIPADIRHQRDVVGSRLGSPIRPDSVPPHGARDRFPVFSYESCGENLHVTQRSLQNACSLNLRGLPD